MSVREYYRPLAPQLVVKDTDEFRAFIKTVFNAEKKLIIRHPDGSVMHAAFKLNGGRILFGQANDKWPPFPAPI